MEATIILPVWNDQERVVGCLDSIKRQTARDFECIVVDDGSTDNTLEAVSNSVAGDGRFSIIHTEHKGLSNARNIGIENASGDVLFHIDSDDLAKPEMMKSALKFMVENDLDMAFYDAEVKKAKDAGRRFSIDTRYFKRSRNYGISSGAKMLSEMVKADDYVYAVFIQAIKKSAIKRKFQYGIRAQDILYSTENIVLQERIGHLSNVLYTKTSRSGSVSEGRLDGHYAWSIFRNIIELAKFSDEEELGEGEQAIERIIRDLFSNFSSASKYLKQEDWEYLKSKPFSDRILTRQLARFTSVY